MAFLELSGVSKGYGSQGSGRVEVLHDINLEIREGEFVAIVGYSGSGKTTLISMMAGLIQPDRGRVRMDGSVPKRALGGGSSFLHRVRGGTPADRGVLSERRGLGRLHADAARCFVAGNAAAGWDCARFCSSPENASAG